MLPHPIAVHCSNGRNTKPVKLTSKLKEKGEPECEELMYKPPIGRGLVMTDLYYYQGAWLFPSSIPAYLAMRKHFQGLVATVPKSGTLGSRPRRSPSFTGLLFTEEEEKKGEVEDIINLRTLTSWAAWKLIRRERRPVSKDSPTFSFIGVGLLGIGPSTLRVIW